MAFSLISNFCLLAQFFSQAAWYVRVLLGLQVLFFPTVAVLLWRFRRSVAALERPPNHLECVLALLAMALVIVNCEWLGYVCIRLFFLLICFCYVFISVLPFCLLFFLYYRCQHLDSASSCSLNISHLFALVIFKQ